MTTADDRAAYLEGEDSVLDPQERRELDGIRDVLASAAVWHEPGREADIVAAIGDPGTADPTPSREERRLLNRRQVLAAAVAVVVVFVAGTIALLIAAR